MKQVGSIIGILAIATLVMLGTKGAVARTQDEAKSFSAAPGGRLEVDVEYGSISIRPSEQALVRVYVDGIPEEYKKYLRIQQNGNVVRVEYRTRENGKQTRHSGSDIRFEIDVPSKFDTQLKTGGGEIEYTGTITGTIAIISGGGEVRLQDVHGPVDIKTGGGEISGRAIDGVFMAVTGGGEIDVETVKGKVEIKTGGGNVDVHEVLDDMTITTGGGEVRLGTVGGALGLRTGGGNIQVKKVAGKTKIVSGGGEVTIDVAMKDVYLKTGGGNIELKYVSGSVDVATGGGEVVAELHPSGNGSSEISTGGGDIILRIPPGAHARIEAEVRIEEHRQQNEERYIRSDFPADAEQSSTSQNEIRKVYVLNGGGEEITLRTSESRIEIRKATEKKSK
jgi:hypothetical protein